MADLPHEVELFEKYKNAGFKTIGINADATMEDGRDAAIDHGTRWLNLYEGREKAISTQFGIIRWSSRFFA